MATEKTTKKSSVKKKVQPKKTKTTSKKVRTKKTIKKSVSKKLVISSKNILKVYKGTNIEVTALNKVNIDIYEGEKIPNDKKSIALNVTIQSSEKTLNDDDLEKINNLIISTVEIKSGAKIRS